jgi:hypothetical protein
MSLPVVPLASSTRPEHRGRRVRVGGFGFATVIAAAAAPHAAVAVLDFVNFNLTLRAVARKAFPHRNSDRRAHIFDSTKFATRRVVEQRLRRNVPFHRFAANRPISIS